MRSTSFQRISKFLVSIYRLQGFSELCETISLELPKLVSGDNVMVGVHDATTRTLKGIVLKTPFSHNHFIAEANETGLLGTHPFWDTILDGDEPLKILSEMIGVQAWKENPFNCEILRADGIVDHINIEFGDRIDSFTTVGVLRSKIGFTDEERCILRMIRPHIVQAFSNAHISDRELATASFDQTNAAMAKLDFRGRWLTPRSRIQLEKAIGLESRLQIENIDSWIRAQIAIFNCGKNDWKSTHQKFRCGRRIMQCELRRDLRNGNYSFVYWFTAEFHSTSEQQLTPREKEVLRWIRESKRNHEIAIILGMSSETVKFHVKNIFRKLGVESRTAAATYDLRSKY